MSKLTTAEQVKLLLNGTMLPWLREAMVVHLAADDSPYPPEELVHGPNATGAVAFGVEIWPVLRPPESASFVSRHTQLFPVWSVGGTVEFPGTREEPPDQEYVEIGAYSSLANAVVAAASDRVRQEILQAWEAQIVENPDAPEP